MEDIRFEMDGTKEDAVIALCNYGIERMEDAEKLLDYLCQMQELLAEDETIENEVGMPDTGAMGLTLADGSYYVNVRTSSIVIAAAILDIILTKGLASAAISLFGVSGTAFVHIEEADGEKCILQETLIMKQKMGNSHILEKYAGKCRNPVSCCKYRQGEECSCTRDDIISIYEKLCAKNVFQRDNAAQVYHYVW